MPGARESRKREPLEVALLWVGTDPSLREWAELALSGSRHRIEGLTALPCPEDSDQLSALDPDLLLIDESAEPDFADRLRAFKARFPRCQILLLGREDSDLSPRRLAPVQIRNWFFRPCDPCHVQDVLAAAGRSLRRERHERERRTRTLPGFEVFVGEDPIFLEALTTARKVAMSGATNVLILGETGTGKGVLAQAIHGVGPRASGPFVELNCAAIPENLVESELFGHARGAFTSADRDKPGLLELADGGTAFLDEIGEVELLAQAKLLKFLDDGIVRRLSGTGEIRIDARVIAATNRNLDQEVRAGRFRLDLYHRLNVIAISLPPLRERRGDIPLLAQHYLHRISRRLRGGPLEWQADTLLALQRYDWPGNVRELAHVIEHTVLLLDGDHSIGLADLPAGLIPSKPAVANSRGGLEIVVPETGVSLREVEAALLGATLERTQGNVTEAARLLRMSRGSLRYRMDKLGLSGCASRRRGRPRRRRAAA